MVLWRSSYLSHITAKKYNIFAINQHIVVKKTLVRWNQDSHVWLKMQDVFEHQRCISPCHPEAVFLRGNAFFFFFLAWSGKTSESLWVHQNTAKATVQCNGLDFNTFMCLIGKVKFQARNYIDRFSSFYLNSARQNGKMCKADGDISFKKHWMKCGCIKYWLFVNTQWISMCCSIILYSIEFVKWKKSKWF